MPVKNSSNTEIFWILAFLSFWDAAVPSLHGDIFGSNHGHSFLHGPVLKQWVHLRLPAVTVF